MIHSQFFPPLFLAILVAAAAATTAAGEERTPTWGWKAEEGLGSSRKPRPVPARNPPRPVPVQNAWQAQVTAPDANLPPANNAGTRPGRRSARSLPLRSRPTGEHCGCRVGRPLPSSENRAWATEEELAKKTGLLEAKKVEYQEWLKRRDEFISKAEANLVKLYSKIKPDAPRFNSRQWTKRPRRLYSSS